MESRIDPGAARTAREEVEAAFPDAPLPASVEVVSPSHWFDEAGASHPGVDLEAKQVEDFFARRRRSSLPPEELLGWKVASSCWGFLSPGAQAYYLPAFLRALLSGPLDDGRFVVLESIVRGLTPPGLRGGSLPVDRRTDAQRQAMDQERERGFDGLVRALTDEQKAAVARFLRVFEAAFEDPPLDNPVRDALDAYWARFHP